MTAPMVTLAELLALRADLELENAAVDGCGTDSLASLRCELGLDA